MWRAAARRRATLYRCRCPVEPPLQTSDYHFFVWPSPYGIIFQAIRNWWFLRLSTQARATMGPEASPIWWRGISAPPPSSWVYVFENLTGDDGAEEWGMAAGIHIARVRHSTSVGPTFTELFSHLLPDFHGLPGPFPASISYLERRRAITTFRRHTAIEWRRRGMIDWDLDVPRSLRIGPAFVSRRRRPG